MKTIFIEEIVEHSFTLKCVPQSDARQTIQKLEVRLIPSASLCEGRDSFGNEVLYGRLKEAHDLFVVRVSGVAAVKDCPLPQKEETDTWIYKYPTRSTAAGNWIRSFIDHTALTDQEKQTPFALAQEMMHAVYGKMYYQAAVTGMSTTAEESFGVGKGVCQDYAHILLAILRQLGIASRYVVGMMRGEGASHAWVEVYENGYWYGLDPTNNQCVDDTYIKISHGRDAKDCLVERGIFRGNGSQQKLVGVKVTEE